jgi:hypothetical protein
MIKECKVIMKNPINMVVLFDGIEVQMPSNDKVSTIAYVEYDNSKYYLSSKDEYEKELASEKRNKTKQKAEEVSEEVID